MKYVIAKSQTGWVVYNTANPDNFYVFRSDEPVRFTRFVAEKIAGIKIDDVVAARTEEVEKARNAWGERK